MAEDKGSLSRLTLRQLRNKARDLGVPLYRRKPKEALIKEICLYQEQEKTDSQLLTSTAEDASSNSLQNSSSTETRVVFLPRDPDWAYVFWEISEVDRKRAQSQGAIRLCLRLSDLTGIGDGTAHRQTLQEIPVDSYSTEW